MAADGVPIGIIGLGEQGRHHLNCLLALPDAKIVALCDSDPRALHEAAGAARSAGAQLSLYADFRSLVEDAALEAVYICLPDDLHAEAAVAALAGGKDVFLEKPIAHTIEDIDRIAEAEQRYGGILQVGLVYRYSMHYREMAQLAGEAGLGRVQMAWCQELRPPFRDVAWYHSQARTGGTLNEKDCHHFDLFNWMIGAKPRRVCAFGSRTVLTAANPYLETSGSPQAISQGDNVDHACVIVEYENGALGQLNLCMFLSPWDWTNQLYEVGLIGANGRMIRSDLLHRRIVLSGGPTAHWEEIPVEEVPGPPVIHAGGVFQHLEFLRCVREREEPFASMRVGRVASVVAFAAEKSLHEARVVDIAEVADLGEQS